MILEVISKGEFFMTKISAPQAPAFRRREYVTNGEKYAGESHNHYVFERMCPKCNCIVCGREPSDFRECSIENEHDYEQWLREYNEDD